MPGSSKGQRQYDNFMELLVALTDLEAKTNFYQNQDATNQLSKLVKESFDGFFSGGFFSGDISESGFKILAYNLFQISSAEGAGTSTPVTQGDLKRSNLDYICGLTADGPFKETKYKSGQGRGQAGIIRMYDLNNEEKNIYKTMSNHFLGTTFEKEGPYADKSMGTYFDTKSNVSPGRYFHMLKDSENPTEGNLLGFDHDNYTAGAADDLNPYKDNVSKAFFPGGGISKLKFVTNRGITDGAALGLRLTPLYTQNGPIGIKHLTRAIGNEISRLSLRDPSTIVDGIGPVSPEGAFQTINVIDDAFKYSGGGNAKAILGSNIEDVFAGTGDAGYLKMNDKGYHDLKNVIAAGFTSAKLKMTSASSSTYVTTLNSFNEEFRSFLTKVADLTAKQEATKAQKEKEAAEAVQNQKDIKDEMENQQTKESFARYSDLQNKKLLKEENLRFLVKNLLKKKENLINESPGDDFDEHTNISITKSDIIEIANKVFDQIENFYSTPVIDMNDKTQKGSFELSSNREEEEWSTSHNYPDVFFSPSKVRDGVQIDFKIAYFVIKIDADKGIEILNFTQPKKGWTLVHQTDPKSNISYKNKKLRIIQDPGLQQGSGSGIFKQTDYLNTFFNKEGKTPGLSSTSPDVFKSKPKDMNRLSKISTSLSQENKARGNYYASLIRTINAYFTKYSDPADYKQEIENSLKAAGTVIKSAGNTPFNFNYADKAGDDNFHILVPYALIGRSQKFPQFSMYGSLTPGKMKNNKLKSRTSKNNGYLRVKKYSKYPAGEAFAVLKLHNIPIVKKVFLKAFHDNSIEQNLEISNFTREHVLDIPTVKQSDHFILSNVNIVDPIDISKAYIAEKGFIKVDNITGKFKGKDTSGDKRYEIYNNLSRENQGHFFLWNLAMCLHGYQDKIANVEKYDLYKYAWWPMDGTASVDLDSGRFVEGDNKGMIIDAGSIGEVEKNYEAFFAVYDYASTNNIGPFAKSDNMFFKDKNAYEDSLEYSSRKSLVDFVNKSYDGLKYLELGKEKGYFHNNNYVAACGAILNDIFYNNQDHSDKQMPQISSTGIRESIELKENLLRKYIREVINKNEKN